MVVIVAVHIIGHQIEFFCINRNGDFKWGCRHSLLHQGGFPKDICTGHDAESDTAACCFIINAAGAAQNILVSPRGVNGDHGGGVGSDTFLVSLPGNSQRFTFNG